MKEMYIDINVAMPWSISKDIRTLCHSSIHVKSHFINSISRVLINNALRSFSKISYCYIIPPLLHVAILIKLSPFVIESVRNFYSKYLLYNKR